MSLGIEVHQDQLIEFLKDPSSYPERPSGVELIETHISWVFLTDKFVYKLKKPVRFSFLDFSTVAKRHRACLDEVRLNRRMAANVYLGVVPVTQSPRGRFRWGGSEMAVDWLVKMRRLPSEACLLELLKQGELSDRQSARLASFLADFYRQQPPLTLRPEPTRNQLAELIHSNQNDLREHLPHEIPRINRLHTAQLRYLSSRAGLFDSRVCDGRFVEGHGDLRPEHIYLLPRPVIIDCIEFSADLRRIDILDELSFLAMECDFAGHPAVGEQVVSGYKIAADDRPPASLLAFYKSYRACVRAKVFALRGSQKGTANGATDRHQAINYLSLAETYLSELGRSLLIVVSGLMGSGKSTLASALAQTLGAPLLQTDLLRREIYGPSLGRSAFGAGVYREELRNAVYHKMFEQCAALLHDAAAVVLDGTFSADWQRQAAAKLAAEHDADVLIVRCDCPRDLAIRRIEQRRKDNQSISEAHEDLYDQQAAAWQPDSQPLPTLILDAQQSLKQQSEAALRHLALLPPSEPSRPAELVHSSPI
jgi:aminoglycoside phosphotransferase family enzyme